MKLLKSSLAKVFLLLLANYSFAQEIKVKKGKVSLDEVEVALIDKKKLVYSFSTLGNVPKFSVELKSRNLLDGSSVYYCLLTDLQTAKTNEILDKGTFSGMSFEKAIVSSVVHGDLKFLTINGIDEKLVSEFINGTKSTVLKDFEEQDSKTISELLTEKKNLEKLKIRIEKSSIIQKQNVIDQQGNNVLKDVVVGYIERKEQVVMQGFAPIVSFAVNSAEIITDSRGKNQEVIKPVANWYKTNSAFDNPVTGKKIKEQIITVDKKSFNLPEIHPENSPEATNTTFGKLDENKLKEAIVAKLIFNGYSIGKPLE